MASGRSQKRARKKERRSARREEIADIMRRRRRRRLIVFAAALGIVAVGVGIIFFARDTSKSKLTASKSPNPAAGVAMPTHKPVACGAKLPPAAGSRKKSYSKPTDLHLNPERKYALHLETSCGNIEVELDAKKAPKTVNSIVFLVRQQFYDGMFFHRIIPGFVIQSGDPVGDGTGGSGYSVVEPPGSGTKYDVGAFAMAKGGNDPPGTSQSQFFIVSGPQAKDLPAEYAYAGKVVSGLDVVQKIDKLGTQSGRPTAWAYIVRASVSLVVGR